MLLPPMRLLCVMIFVAISRRSVFAFTTRALSNHRSGTLATKIGALPTTTEAASDNFMKQLNHASEIIPFLAEKSESRRISEILSSQLRHSDGIRGFFAVYLTSPEADVDVVPNVLVDAVRNSDPDVLVPLACKNVVMPTAMSSMHTDPELQASAAQTARNGKRILNILKDHILVNRNCEAISRVCAGSDENDELTKHWEGFMTNCGYEAKQKVDIGEAVSEFF